MSVWKTRLRVEGTRLLFALAALASFIYALGAARKW